MFPKLSKVAVSPVSSVIYHEYVRKPAVQYMFFPFQGKKNEEMKVWRSAGGDNSTEMESEEHLNKACDVCVTDNVHMRRLHVGVICVWVFVCGRACQRFHMCGLHVSGKGEVFVIVLTQGTTLARTTTK